MIKYEIKTVFGTSKKGNKFKALQIVAHTDLGDYLSPYLFPNTFRPAVSLNWFNDDDSSTGMGVSNGSVSDLGDIYNNSEIPF